MEKILRFVGVLSVARISRAVRNSLWPMVLCLIWPTIATNAFAGSECSGALTEPQQQGFGEMFSPAYSAKLVHVGGAIAPKNMSKKLTSDEVKRLKVPGPIVVARYSLSADRAKLLKSWLNENASATLPSWISTTAGIVAPQAWVGLTADVFIQLINGAGDAGRLQVANIAGTVSEGGLVGVTEQVASDSSGKNKFLWTYIYQASLNGRLLTTPLTVCSADVVTQ